MLKHSRTKFLALGIVGLATFFAFLSSLGDAPIVDEVPHIGAGYSYVTKLDFRLNPEHPPLVKDIAGIPLLFLKLNQSVYNHPTWTTDVNGQWNFGRQLIFGSGNDADAIKNWSRLAVLLVFFWITSYFIWRWSYERYGDTAALIATTLFAFSPTVLAHVRFVTTDVAAATGVLVATYFFVRYLQKSTLPHFWLAGITLGLALLCKFNTVLLGPYFLLIAIMWGGRKCLPLIWRTVLIGLVAIAVVWGVYLVQTWNYPVARQVHDTASILAGQPDNPAKSFVLWASDKPVIRAFGHWTLGLIMVAQRAGGGNTIYWLGNVVNAGGPLYFPLVYFLKEPLAWWALVAIALGTLSIRKKDRPHHTEEWVWLLWLAIYWLISIRSTLNIGVRHLMPIFPFTIILVAGRVSFLIDWLHHHHRKYLKIAVVTIALLIGWHVFESVRVFPYYLTYFNQVAGGPSGGYRYVADSNLDWGQDLKRLGNWMEDNTIPRISLDYFGWSDPQYYLKDRYVYTSAGQFKNAQDFIRRNRSNGWIAISGTYLQQANYSRPPSNNYHWLLDYEPVIVVGNSLFVWHIK